MSLLSHTVSTDLSPIATIGGAVFNKITVGRKRTIKFNIANEGPHELVFRDIALNESEPWSVVPVGANGSSSVSHPNLLSPPPSTLQHNSPTGVFKLVSVPPVPLRLPAGHECECVVSFSPSTHAFYSASVDFISLDSTKHPSQRVTLHGEGEVPTSPQQIIYNSPTSPADFGFSVVTPAAPLGSPAFFAHDEEADTNTNNSNNKNNITNNSTSNVSNSGISTISAINSTATDTLRQPHFMKSPKLQLPVPVVDGVVGSSTPGPQGYNSPSSYQITSLKFPTQQSVNISQEVKISELESRIAKLERHLNSITALIETASDNTRNTNNSNKYRHNNGSNNESAYRYNSNNNNNNTHNVRFASPVATPYKGRTLMDMSSSLDTSMASTTTSSSFLFEDGDEEGQGNNQQRPLSASGLQFLEQLRTGEDDNSNSNSSNNNSDKGTVTTAPTTTTTSAFVSPTFQRMVGLYERTGETSVAQYSPDRLAAMEPKTPVMNAMYRQANFSSPFWTTSPGVERTPSPAPLHLTPNDQTSPVLSRLNNSRNSNNNNIPTTPMSSSHSSSSAMNSTHVHRL